MDHKDLYRNCGLQQHEPLDAPGSAKIGIDDRAEFLRPKSHRILGT
ncbi:hypothetical protein U1769_06780 [Sphingomonas sp. ZT3P38]